MLDPLDNSSKELRNQRKEVEKFLGQNQGRLAYPVSIGLLTDAGARVGKVSSDGNALISELKQLPLTGSAPVENDQVQPWHSAGKTTVNNMSNDEELSRRNRHFLLAVPSLTQLAKGQEDVPGRVLLIWIGPGWPLLAGPEFHADSRKTQTSFFAYIVDLSSALRVAQMTLYEVSPTSLVKHSGVRPQGDDPESYLLLKNGLQTLSDAKAGNLALPVLAYQSGGRIMDQSQDLASEIIQCIADAESYYVLSFDSSSAKTPDEYHSLQVEVDKAGMTIRTTKAYYAQQ
jgi:VWFA-related protein